MAKWRSKKENINVTKEGGNSIPLRPTGTAGELHYAAHELNESLCIMSGAISAVERCPVSEFVGQSEILTELQDIERRLFAVHEKISFREGKG